MGEMAEYRGLDCRGKNRGNYAESPIFFYLSFFSPSPVAVAISSAYQADAARWS